jgi:hypothetical protein
MPIVATPEVGIPLPFDTTPEEIDDFRQKAHAMFLTIEELHKQGLPVEVTEADKKEAHIAFAASKMPKSPTPGAIVHLEAMLSEWDHEVLDASRRLRNYVTNKLLLETADPDSKVRLRALELLGKVSSVGLFSERIDVTVTHRSINDIENELKKTLELFGGDVIDVEELETQPEAPKSVAEIDLDAELGTEKPEELQETSADES